MTLSDLLKAGVRFDRDEILRIGADEGEDVNAAIMILLSATVGAFIGTQGISIGPSIPIGMSGLAVVLNPLWEIYTVLVLGWGVLFVFRKFGVDEQFSTMIRLLGITRVWAILGYMLMLFTPYGVILAAVGLLEFVFILGTTFRRGWVVSGTTLVLGILVAFIVTVLIFLSMTFFIMFALL